MCTLHSRFSPITLQAFHKFTNTLLICDLVLLVVGMMLEIQFLHSQVVGQYTILRPLVVNKISCCGNNPELMECLTRSIDLDDGTRMV